MDDNVMRVLQMLQDGKITAQEAEMLIAALRGETRSSSAGGAATEQPQATAPGSGSTGGARFRPPKIELDDIGKRISEAVARVQPEKIVRRVQAQLRTATRAGAHWGSTVSARVRTWTEGADTRPVNEGDLPEQTVMTEQELHLEPGAFVTVDNPLGNVKVTGVTVGPAVVSVRKHVWAPRQEEIKTVAEQVQISINGTDQRLDVRIEAPDYFRDGTVDLELRVPTGVRARVSTHFGEVEIAQIDGPVEGVTTSGELRLLDVKGDVRGETASGNIRLARIDGTATVATQSGHIRAEDIGRGLSANAASGDVRAMRLEGGRVECKSVSGDVHVEHVGLLAPVDIVIESISGDAALREANGNIALKAVSGDIRAEQITASRLQAQTVSGDVTIKLQTPFSGTMQVNTVSGNVHIALPEGSHLRVSLGTASGELRCECDAHDVSATATLWTGQIGTGAGTLNVQTISGDTHIHRAR